MKPRLIRPVALALAFTLASALAAKAAYTNWEGNVITNGTILIVTRSAQDAWWHIVSSTSLWDADDNRGPGICSPGDAEMANLLQAHGYSTRMVPERCLWYEMLDWLGSPANPPGYYEGGCLPSGCGQSAANVQYSAQLVIVSGSGGSADMPPPNTNGIPIVMGEHSCVGDKVLNGHASLFMYGHAGVNPGATGDVSGTTPGLGQYMKVTAAGKAHPILQGIPLDAENRVKVWRDPYPEENAHLPSAANAKPNWRYSWLTVGADKAAAGTAVLGLLGTDESKAVFAVMDKGGTLADTTAQGEAGHPWYGYTTAPSRLVQCFVNERGSGDSRRAFNNLTDLGRVIFVRACKWAMGETLPPYQPLKVIRVSQVNGQQIQLEWNGTATKNYKILGTASLANNPSLAYLGTGWQTIVEDIAGTDGPVSVKLDISGGPQYAFLQVAQVP